MKTKTTNLHEFSRKMNKKIIFKISFVILLFAFILASCTSKQTVEHSQTEGDYYTCPMHPTVVQEEEGDCPICGMDLVLEKGKSTQASDKTESTEKKIKYWVAPMDPNYVSDVPGKSPMGMDLVPVYEDEVPSGKGITIDPTVVQNMGVRVKHVSYRDISHNIRTIGNVEIADDKSYSINLRFSGWIETIFADKIGQKINKGEKLFEIYSPELISAQEEYLLAVNTYGKSSKVAEASRKRLLLWNIPNKHLAKILFENNAQQNVIFISPFSGYILHKNIKEGSNVKAGTDLYHIGNLDTVWIIADLYEFDAASVKIGQNAKIEVTNLPGNIRTGYVSFIYPTINPKTRTQRIRVELENSDLSLKPGMFVTIRIEADRANKVLTVPTEAIINSGERKIVFLSRGNGKFEPREIQTGLADDKDYYTEVISGLEENEIVVVSGQFLLDSESQLQEAVQKLLDVKFRSSSNSEVNDKHDHSGDTYFTCPMHPTIVQDEAGDCPICGMDLIEKEQ
ncbi:MAG: efflux RND transporter periplasmic adaptor subunit [Candidatus Cloacimonetes bacterium]|jgi:Cu(I)/Ag(I) efflux system membrane fusion protein|nr:efflux RND transporter periplasmic adaptor subunit [Candidatus Cloacimonadota bacterium]